MKYAPSLLSVDRESITKENPFMVSEVNDAEPLSYMRNYEELGMLYDTWQEAMEAAKAFYWRRTIERLSRPWKPGETNAEIYYDVLDSRLYVRTYGPDSEFKLPMVTNPYMFGSKQDALKALEEIGEANYAKYVLGLTEVDLLIRQRL